MAYKTDIPFYGGRIKFIVVKCGEDTWIMARNHELHEHIFTEFTFTHWDIKGKAGCECIGGGRIHYSTVHKTIRAYGFSQQYGKADQEIVERLVDAYVKEEQEEEVGEWKVKVEMGIGY